MSLHSPLTRVSIWPLLDHHKYNTDWPEICLGLCPFMDTACQISHTVSIAYSITYVDDGWPILPNGTSFRTVRMIPHDTIKMNEYRNHSEQRFMISSEVISELILNFDILSALFCCFSSQSEAVLIFIIIESHYNSNVTIFLIFFFCIIIQGFTIQYVLPAVIQLM